VIHDGKRFVETFGRNYVLVVDALVIITRSGAVTVKPDMMLSRYVANFLVIRHDRSSFVYVVILIPQAREKNLCSFASLLMLFAKTDT
jgi:hypothetical protein